MDSENVKRNWVARKVKTVVKFAMFAAVAATVFGLLVKGLWNWLMPPLFGLHALTFEQALGLLALSWILFGGFRGRPGQRWRRGFVERWEEMSPGQREKVWTKICGHGPDFAGPAAEQKS
jgi:Ca2+/H+ antiporter, TMEM165/GDT1 family